MSGYLLCVVSLELLRTQLRQGRLGNSINQFYGITKTRTHSVNYQPLRPYGLWYELLVHGAMKCIQDFSRESHKKSNCKNRYKVDLSLILAFGTDSHVPCASKIRLAWRVQWRVYACAETLFHIDHGPMVQDILKCYCTDCTGWLGGIMLHGIAVASLVRHNLEN